MTSRRSIALGALAIALVTGLTYRGSLDGAFVSDDVPTIERSEKIRALDWPHVRTMLTTFEGANYMPVTVLSLAVDYSLWGLDPTGYHLTNLVLHVGCAWLVYALLLRLRFPLAAALLVALLWAVHPLQVESVAWISERKNVLSGLAFFAAFGCWIRWTARGGTGAYAALLTLFTVALLAKLNTMVLPAVGLAHAATIQGGVRRRDVLATVPLLVLGALVAAYNLAGNPVHGVAWHGGGRVVTWLTTIVVPFRYLREVVLPVGLSPWYYVPLRDSLLDPPVLAAAAAALALIGLTAWLVVRRRPEAFWLLWFGITLAPMLNLLVPGASLKQDRFMYLALLGPLALAGHAGVALPTRGLRRGAAAAGCVAVLVCAVLSHRQVEVWSDALSMWQWSARHQSNAAVDPGRPDPDHEAKVRFLEAALAREPGSTAVRNNLAALRYATGRIDEAIAEWQVAATRDPDDFIVAYNLGRAYARQGDLEAAREWLERAAAAAPHFIPIHMHLARVHLARGDTAGARRALDTCTRLRPDPLAQRAWQRERLQLERLEAAAH